MFDQLWFISLCCFLLCLAFYHCSEYFLTWYFNPKELSPSSWLFSRPYLIAMGLSLVEFFVELFFFPSLKNGYGLIFLIGLIMTVIGEGIRKIAMITAKQSFTHLIKESKRPEHVLIRHGIYAYVRHPGYLGWFIWAPSTQIILRNPISSVLFVAWGWYFFADRIPDEEESLIKNIFGEEYKRYRDQTPTWIPFIK